MDKLFLWVDNRKEKIDKIDKNLSGKIDKVLDELKDHNDIINNHERRIEKIEETSKKLKKNA